MVQFFLHELQSKIRYRIILPFLLLTLLVALAGSTVALKLAADTQQERFSNQVAEVTRTTNDELLNQEIVNLQYLNRIIFSPPNPESGAPAVITAMETRDRTGLQRALTPYFTAGQRDPGVNLDRLLAFDTTGSIIVDLERDPLNATQTITTNDPLQLSTTPGSFANRVLSAQADDQGDKFAGLMELPTNTGLNGETTNEVYFATITPVYESNNDDNPVIGGMILAMRVDSLLDKLVRRSRAAVVIIYDNEGRALYSTRDLEPDQEITSGDQPEPQGPLVPERELDLAELNINQESLTQLREGQTEAEQSVMDVVSINQRSYQLGYTPLMVRQAQLGYIAAGLSYDYVLSTLADIREPIMWLTGAFMLAIVGLGIYIARQITLPLEELVATAQSVTAGDLRRRSQVQTKNEIGELSQSFNTMTESLLHMYNRVLAESGQLAAIVESITDGIVVCNRAGNIQMINKATRKLLNLDDDSPPPARFSDLPLVPLGEGQKAFSPEHSVNLQVLGDRFVRVSDAPIVAKGRYLGDVYVLQDMTDEVNIDRAKTNFIGTISHELRSPITILRGTTDLLLRGMFGRLEERQSTELDIMQQKLVGMTNLLNNVIVIADIDSGSLPFEFEPLDLLEVVEEATWKMQTPIKDKGLDLELDIPDDLPQVLADYDHLQSIIKQLVDNAQRYTQTGSITIRASRQTEFVRIDIIDTGPGIDTAIQEQVFERFVRGMGRGQGVDSQERGLGLGLAIAKQLVDRHGGQIWLAETSETGTTFSFTLRHTDVMGTPEQQDTALGTAAA